MEAVLIPGIPGIGKSTMAQRDFPNHTRVERDILREEMAGSREAFYQLPNRPQNEEIITDRYSRQLRTLAKNKANIVISDTLINRHNRRDLYKILFDLGYTIKVEPVRTSEHSLEEAQTLNANREEDHVVPEHAVEYFLNRWNKELPTIIEEMTVLNFRYMPTGHDKHCLVCDIDGTIADHTGVRSPFDYDKVDQDMPIDHIIGLLPIGVPKFFFSGRENTCYEKTRQWLIEQDFFVGFGKLRMRQEGDHRVDWLVKGEIMIDFLMNEDYNIDYVFDDRQQVVNIWKNMGLPVIQVAQNKF